MRGIFQGLYLAPRSLSRTRFLTVNAQKPNQGSPHPHYLVEVSNYWGSKHIIIFLLRYKTSQFQLLLSIIYQLKGVSDMSHI